MEKNVNIDGMSCAACSSSIERVIGKMDGVNRVSVNLTTNSAVIDFDEGVVDFDSIVNKIHKLGFSVPTGIDFSMSKKTEDIRNIEIHVDGMSCAACSSSIERVIGKMDGVDSISVNLTTAKAAIQYNNDVVRLSEIFAKIEKLGFKPLDISVDEEINRSISTTERELKLKWHQFRLSAVFSLILMYVSMGHMVSLPLPHIIDRMANPLNYAILQLILTIPVMIIGKNFYTNGFRSLIRRIPNMDSLIAVSTTAAFIYSVYSTLMIHYDSMNAMLHVGQLYFETVVMIITLIFMGKTLEFRSKSHTSDAIKKLINLRPKSANVLVNGKTVSMSVDRIELGDIILVKAGETIAVDGEIVSGSTSVDESLISGESMPVVKSVGDDVVGGSINISGVIKVKMTKSNSDSVINRIIKMVEDAQAKKAPIAKIADLVSGYFVPVVMVIALVSGLLWYFSGADIDFSIKIFVSVLVIACPCALGLATPTAIMVGTGRATKEGVLIKSGEALESIHNIDVVLLDKTGTITEGRPKVTGAITSDNYDSSQVLSYLYAVERQSTHPLAVALCEYCNLNSAATISTTSITEIAGKGVKAEFEDRVVLVGSEKYLQESGVDTKALEPKELAATAVYMAIDSELAAIFSVEDTIKESSITAISELKKLGIKTVMLTGDNEMAAAKIADISGVDEYKAGLLPEDKSNVVKEYREAGYFTAMIGDGINDAPSLALSDVGFAIGRGTDVAVESADIVLMKDDLQDSVFAIRMSRATLRNIKQNLFFAFIYNILGIPFAAGIFYAFGGPTLNPMIGALAMSLSSVSVVSNALRLRSFK